MKKYEFKIKFKEEYYNVVRAVVNNFYYNKPFMRWYRKGIFKSNIICREEGNYTTIWFNCIPTKLKLELCREVLHDLEKFEIIEIVKES